MRSTFTTMLLVRVATSVTVAAIILAVGYSSQSTISAPYALFAAAGMLVSELLSELIQAGLAGLGRQNLASGLLVLQRALVLSSVVAPVIPGLDRWLQFLAGTLIALCVPVGAAFVLLVARPVPAWGLLKTSAGYWASTAVASVGQLDVSVAQLTVGSAASGLVSAGNRVGTPLNLVTQAMLNVFVPSLTIAEPVRRGHLFRRMRVFSGIYALVVMCASPLISSALIFVLGEEYESGRVIYTAIVIGAAFSGLSQVYQALIYSIGRPFVSAWVVGGGSLVGLIAAALGGLFLGLDGLALGPVVGQVIILILFHVLVARLAKLGDDPGR